MKTLLTIVAILSLLTVGSSFSFHNKKVDENPLHGSISPNSTLLFQNLALKVDRNLLGNTLPMNNEPVMSDDEKLVVYRETPYQVNVYDVTKQGKIVFQANIFGQVKRFQFSQDSKYLYIIMDRGQYLEFISYDLKKKSLITSQIIEAFDDVYIFQEINVLAGRKGLYFYQYPLVKDRSLDLNGKYVWQCDTNFGSKIRFALPPKQDRKPYIHVSALFENQQNSNQTEIYILRMKPNYIDFNKYGTTDHKYSDIQNHVFFGLFYFDVVMTTESSLLYYYGNTQKVYDLGQTFCNTQNRTAVFSQLSGNNERTILCWNKFVQAQYVQIPAPSGSNITANFVTPNQYGVGFIQPNEFTGYLSKNSDYLITKKDGQVSGGFTVLIPTGGNLQQQLE